MALDGAGRDVAAVHPAGEGEQQGAALQVGCTFQFQRGSSHVFLIVRRFDFDFHVRRQISYAEADPRGQKFAILSDLAR